jgi:hypothetical protein
VNDSQAVPFAAAVPQLSLAMTKMGVPQPVVAGKFENTLAK